MNNESSFTNGELELLEDIKNDLILELFDTKDKRYTLLKYLKKSFNR